MISRKLLVIFSLFIVVGVIGLTWFPTNPDSPTNPELSNNSTGGNSTDMVGLSSQKLPTGIGTGEVVPSALISEHRDALGKSTYTLTVTVETVKDGGKNRVQRTTYRKDKTATYARTTINGELVSERYSETKNGTLYVRKVTEDGVEYSIHSGQQLSPANEPLLQNMLEGGQWHPTQYTEDGKQSKTTIRTESVRGNQLKEALAVDSVRDFSGRMVVTGSQHIVSAQTTVSGKMSGSNVTIRYRSHLSAINQTILSRPEWTSEAQNTTRQSLFGFSSDQRSIYASHQGGKTIPAGSTVNLFIQDGDTYKKQSETLSQPFSKDETLFITLVDGELKVYKDEVPALKGDKLNADAYYVEVIPSDSDSPVIEFEISPSSN